MLKWSGLWPTLYINNCSVMNVIITIPGVEYYMNDTALPTVTACRDSGVMLVACVRLYILMRLRSPASMCSFTLFCKIP